MHDLALDQFCFSMPFWRKEKGFQVITQIFPTLPALRVYCSWGVVGEGHQKCCGLVVCSDLVLVGFCVVIKH